MYWAYRWTFSTSRTCTFGMKAGLDQYQIGTVGTSVDHWHWDTITRNRHAHRENVLNIPAICLPIMTMQHIRESLSVSNAMGINAWNVVITNTWIGKHGYHMNETSHMRVFPGTWVERTRIVYLWHCTWIRSCASVGCLLLKWTPLKCQNSKCATSR